MKSIIIILLLLFLIGGITLTWPEKSARTDTGFDGDRNNNTGASHPDRNAALSDEVLGKKQKSNRKKPSKNRSRFTAADRLKNLEVQNIDIETVAEIKKSLQSGSALSEPKENSVSIKTIDEAFDFMNKNVNMAYIPEKYFEDDDAFYFSGGTTAHAVLDFSSGISVNKKDRKITSWKLKP